MEWMPGAAMPIYRGRGLETRKTDWKIIYTLHGRRCCNVLKAESMGAALMQLSDALGDFRGIIYLNQIYECGTKSGYPPVCTEDEFKGAMVDHSDYLQPQRAEEILLDESEFDEILTMEDFVPVYEMLAL